MEVSPQFLYHHCVRTFLFAELTGQRHMMKYDRELLYLGALMHELGLTERFYGNQRFEVDGADAARLFLVTSLPSTTKSGMTGASQDRSRDFLIPRLSID
jgi:hypothetical protein